MISPRSKIFLIQVAWLAEKFEKDYTLNWRGPLGYTEVLRAAPSLSIPDDHEYWNNFPHPSPFIGNSLTPDGRNRWREAAQAMYAGFQLPYPAQLGEPVRVEIAPLSFFVADTRSTKDQDRRFTMSDDAHQQMEQWVSDTIANRQFGVFIAGNRCSRKPSAKLPVPQEIMTCQITTIMAAYSCVSSAWPMLADQRCASPGTYTGDVWSAPQTSVQAEPLILRSSPRRHRWSAPLDRIKSGGLGHSLVVCLAPAIPGRAILTRMSHRPSWPQRFSKGDSPVPRSIARKATMSLC